MKAQWRTWYGQTPIQKKRTSQYLRGKTKLCFSNFMKTDNPVAEAQGTLLVLAWSTNSWRPIGCHIYYVRISCVWRVTPHCSTGICQLYGLHRIIAIDVATRQASWRYDQMANDFSMFSRLHQKMKGTGRHIRRSRTLEARYVMASILR